MWQVPVHGLINARVIALYHLDKVWQQKQKRRKTKSQGHTRRWAKQQKHHAETRDPPSQDPRDHMAQAIRHNSSHIVTSKQTTTKPCRNESGEKKGETDSETWANVRHDEGARQPTGHAQSPLSSAFPIIILLDSSPPLFQQCMLMGTVPKTVHLGSRQDWTTRLCSSSVRGEIWAFSSSDDVLAPLAVRGISSMAFCAWLTS